MSDWLKKHGRKVLMAILAAVLAVSLTVTAVQRAQDRANAEANAEAAELAGLPPVRDQPAVESRDARPGGTACHGPERDSGDGAVLSHRPGRG